MTPSRKLTPINKIEITRNVTPATIGALVANHEIAPVAIATHRLGAHGTTTIVTVIVETGDHPIDPLGTIGEGHQVRRGRIRRGRETARRGQVVMSSLASCPRNQANRGIAARVNLVLGQIPDSLTEEEIRVIQMLKM